MEKKKKGEKKKILENSYQGSWGGGGVFERGGDQGRINAIIIGFQALSKATGRERAEEKNKTLINKGKGEWKDLAKQWGTENVPYYMVEKEGK